MRVALAAERKARQVRKGLLARREFRGQWDRLARPAQLARLGRQGRKDRPVPASVSGALLLTLTNCRNPVIRLAMLT